MSFKVKQFHSSVGTSASWACSSYEADVTSLGGFHSTRTQGIGYELAKYELSWVRIDRHPAWQAVPHLCTSNRKSTTSDRWPTVGWNVRRKPFSGGWPEPASVRHVGVSYTCEWRPMVVQSSAVRGKSASPPWM